MCEFASTGRFQKYTHTQRDRRGKRTVALVLRVRHFRVLCVSQGISPSPSPSLPPTYTHTHTNTHTIRGPRNATTKNKKKLKKLKNIPKKKEKIKNIPKKKEKKRLCSDQRPAVLRLLSFKFQFTHTFPHFTVCMCVCVYFYGAHCIARVCECVCVREVYINSHTFLICLQSSERRRATPTAFACSLSIAEREKKQREQRYQNEVQN